MKIRHLIVASTFFTTLTLLGQNIFLNNFGAHASITASGVTAMKNQSPLGNVVGSILTSADMNWPSAGYTNSWASRMVTQEMIDNALFQSAQSAVSLKSSSVGSSLIASLPPEYDEPPAHHASPTPQLLFNYYADLVLIKEILPDELFRSQILPLVQAAFKSEPVNQITPEDWRTIEHKLLSLKETAQVDYAALYLKYLEKKTLSESLSKAMNDMGADLNTLGKDLGSEISNFLEESFKKESKTTPEELPPTHNL